MIGKTLINTVFTISAFLILHAAELNGDSSTVASPSPSTNNNDAVSTIASVENRVNCTNGTDGFTNTSCVLTTPTPQNFPDYNILGITDRNFQMYLRAFYVVIAVTGLIVIYLVVKTVM